MGAEIARLRWEWGRGLWYCCAHAPATVVGGIVTSGTGSIGAGL